MRDLVLRLIDMAKKVMRWLVIIAAIGICLIMIINFVDVIGTKFFGKSVPGALDITEEVMALVALFPVAYVCLERGHFSISLLKDIMHPALRFIIDIIQYLIATVVSGFISVRTFTQFQTTLSTMTLKEGIDIPIWPANLATSIAFAFLTLAWILLLARTLVTGVEMSTNKEKEVEY
jgi:TRAP-type C4-dicarboxylate transport system permease small subunit